MEKASKSSRIILVVDDHTDYLIVFQAAFEKHGLQVLSSSSPSGGLQIVQDHLDQLSAVFLDIHMPEMNGIEMAKQIRSMGYKRGLIAITAATAISGNSGKNEASAAGFDLYLSKQALKPSLIEALVSQYCK